MTSPLVHEKVWFNKHVYDAAEKQYFEKLAKLLVNNGMSVSTKHSLPLTTVSDPCPVISIPQPLPVQNKKTIIIAPDYKQKPPINVKDKGNRFKVKDSERNKQNKKMVEKKNEANKVSSNTPIMKQSLAGEVAKARQHIQNSLECMDGIAALASNPSVEVNKRLTQLEKQNQNLHEEVNTLKDLVKKLSADITNINKNQTVTASAAPATNTPAKPQPAQQKPNNDADDGIDLFGSDSEEEDAEAKRVREQRLAEYACRKAKKPILIAKSNIILDVKPWDDETDMKELEAHVRKVNTDGLIWGASKLVPLAYGIHKLQISCVVEDDKVSVDWLQETIQEIEDYVQSVDIAAFNKV